MDLLVESAKIIKSFDEDNKLSWDIQIAVEWEWGTLKVISPRGLIQLKSLRNNGQDKDDIKYLSDLIDED